MQERQVRVARRARRRFGRAVRAVRAMAVDAAALHRGVHAGRAIGVTVRAAVLHLRAVLVVAVRAELVRRRRARALGGMTASARALLFAVVRIVAVDARRVTLVNDRGLVGVAGRARDPRPGRLMARIVAVALQAVRVLRRRVDRLMAAGAQLCARRMQIELVRLVTVTALPAVVKCFIRCRLLVAARARDRERSARAIVRVVAIETRPRMLRMDLAAVARLACFRRRRAHVVVVVTAETAMLRDHSLGERDLFGVTLAAAAQDLGLDEAMLAVTRHAARRFRAATCAR